jgi:hypothetical protein
MSIDETLDIMRQETRQGKIDISLVREFEIMLQEMFLLF